MRVVKALRNLAISAGDPAVLKEFINRELVPLVREIREAVNRIAPDSQILSGLGTPEGAVFGSVGDVFCRRDGGAGTSFYVKETGTKTNTGWVGK